MKIYKFVLICSICTILSGCSMFLTKTEESSSQEVSQVIKNEVATTGNIQETKEENLNLKEEQIEIVRGHLVDEQIVSPIGECKTYFEKYGDMKVKIRLLNTGTERFVYKIRNLDVKGNIAIGSLNKNESFEEVFDQLPEGFYSISTLVYDEEPSIEIALSVKVDLVEYE
ncbi:hypothetical protein [Lysinibacillus fusiformis]|uniref:hypothetical protein n=1 Tax=Lysinibacillus fusiformis TaxID=28031 RepID=UPI0011A216D0|nr:hypothetical protein [Lysinibacillus fusiformis]